MPNRPVTRSKPKPKPKRKARANPDFYRGRDGLVHPVRGTQNYADWIGDIGAGKPKYLRGKLRMTRQLVARDYAKRYEQSAGYSSPGFRKLRPVRVAIAKKGREAATEYLRKNKRRVPDAKPRAAKIARRLFDAYNRANDWGL